MAKKNTKHKPRARMAANQPAWQCFEDEVHAALKKELAAGFFPFDGKAKVLRGQKYPGLTPGSTIPIEVSLEAYRENATEPFLIWLWECKSKGNRKVEVGAVRELYSKMLEIGVGRAGGSLVTTIGFQSGAFDLAKKLGISLYLLKKMLVPITSYDNGAETLRQVIFADSAIDLTGAETLGLRFSDILKADFGQLLLRMLHQPDRSDPWESLKKRLKERPIHAGGQHFTRDELHERR